MTESTSARLTIKQFVTSDGYRHNYRHWRPATSRPKAYVVALHGIQSHSGWYEHSSGKLCEAGHEVIFVDRRGSGLNEKERGHTRHKDRLINDVVQILTEVRNRRNEEAPAAPVVLLGLSWGGKLAAVTAAQHGELIDGLALLYPGIRAQVHPTRWQRFKLGAAEAVELEEKRIPIPLDQPSLFTTNVEKQNFIQSDPLALRDVTVAFLYANRDFDAALGEAKRTIRCPAVLMLAGQDRIIDNPVTREWFENLATQERRVHEYENSGHTLEFEPSRDQFIADLISWLDDLCIVT
ncbi:MAG: alpha/beta fold hydrolase [Planctomycetota bacterium]|nr:alpha/beta fold hydrolase [Planctomycetota bacterium]MDA1252598.1 alpha/beta fold hydrolase [Planctomycetota bacterium]